MAGGVCLQAGAEKGRRGGWKEGSVQHGKTCTAGGMNSRANNGEDCQIQHFASFHGTVS